MMFSHLLFFIFFLSHAFGQGNPCNSHISFPKSKTKEFEECKKFKNAWVKESKLKRNPFELAADMKDHAERVDRSGMNISCIDFMSGRIDHLTEAELEDLKKRNSQNISDGLIAGHEKSRLTREAVESREALINAAFDANAKKDRIPVFAACIQLLDQRYEEIQRAYDRLPKAKESNPPVRKRVKKTDVG